MACEYCNNADVGGSPTHLCPEACPELKWHRHPCARCRNDNYNRWRYCTPHTCCSVNISGQREEYERWIRGGVRLIARGLCAYAHGSLFLSNSLASSRITLGWPRKGML
jgi:hypothetical protein